MPTDYADPHIALCRSEHATPRVTPCVDCGSPWDGEVSREGDGPVCLACHIRDVMDWSEFGVDAGELTGFTPAGVVVARILHAKEGEADGGVVNFARYMAAHLDPTNPILARPPSPAGWYWTGTTDERGKWRKAGPYPTRGTALRACCEAFAAGAYRHEAF